jgi:hypothetical protein
LDAANVYWTTIGGAALDTPVVRRMAKQGGPAVDLVTSTPGQLIQFTALDASALYFVRGASTSSAADIVRFDLLSNQETVLAPAEKEVGSLALSATQVYWPSLNANRIRSASKLSGPSADALYAPSVSSIDVVDPKVLFWSWLLFPGVVVASAIDGSGAHRTLAQGVTTALPAADNENLYWMNDNTVVAMPKDGSRPPHRIVLGPPVTVGNGFQFVAVDADSVYFTNWGAIGLNNGQVLRVGKNHLAQPTCANGVRDGDESDVDCGGSCYPCPDRKTCKTASDCGSQVCNTTYQTCGARVVYCYDGKVDLLETDVDCGGLMYCEGCYPGQQCKVASDCASNNCASGVCTF